MNKTMSDMLNSPDLEDVELALIMCRQQRWSAWHVRQEFGRVLWPTARFELLHKYIIKGNFNKRKKRYRYKWIKDESESQRHVAE